MDKILNYFPDLTEKQKNHLQQLGELFLDWNSKINLVSRKDIDQLFTRHILHSLTLAKIITPVANTHFLDVGTGGGFPGLPLAILFPNCKFHLVDSIGKKIMVVNDIIEKLELKNVKAEKSKAQNVVGKYDFVVTRAVTKITTLVDWTTKNIKRENVNSFPNGIISWKGGDLSAELQDFPESEVFFINNYFSDDFFETKKIILTPIS